MAEDTGYDSKLPRKRTTSLLTTLSSRLRSSGHITKHFVAPDGTPYRKPSLLRRHLSSSAAATTTENESAALGDTDDDGLQQYLQRATFAQSSPELAKVETYQAWPNAGAFVEPKLLSQPRTPQDENTPVTAIGQPARAEFDRSRQRSIALAKLIGSAGTRTGPAERSILQPTASLVINASTTPPVRPPPTPLPLEMNLRGRLLRAKSNQSGHLVVGSFDSSSSRSQSSSQLTAVSVKTIDDRDVNSGPRLPKPSNNSVSDPPATLYSNNRMVESAVDMLAVVDEDGSCGSSHQRFASKRRFARQSASPPSSISHGHRHSLDGRVEAGADVARSNSTTRLRVLTQEKTRPGDDIQRSFSASLAELSGTDEPPKQLITVPARGGLTPRMTDDRRRHSSQSPVLGAQLLRTKLVLHEDGKPPLTYQLGECIGRGQFGAVYRALNLNSGRVVAVKRISLAGKTKVEIDQLSSEVQLLKALSHPSVVQYEGLVKTEHNLNIILEFVENGSLQKTLKAFGELPEALVASYVVKILESLDYLHSQGVVHCDLKGEMRLFLHCLVLTKTALAAANILTTKNGNIKLSDFGVSLNLNAIVNQSMSASPRVDGTPNWMPPEVIQLRGASTASDIWSLGCTIIELVKGKPPYAELNAMSAMFRIVEDDCPPIPACCSSELADFLKLCFAKNPFERPTAVELLSHHWLELNWDPKRDLRPQDSLPFLRRFSQDTARPSFDNTAIDGVGDPFASDVPGVHFDPSVQAPRHARARSNQPHVFVKTSFSKAIFARDALQQRVAVSRNAFLELSTRVADIR
ncbi:Protein kinase of the Mitotic Exit Network [Microbotryomycetes sp. JL201]|nr:Protein kinase of the Mitotic Exit Network [Microbotryomycetes sp. JL201]